MRSMIILIILAGCFLFCGGAPGLSGNPAEGAMIFTSAPDYEPLAWLEGKERFPRGAELIVRDGSENRSLVRDFAASTDPSVSPDATRVLFAGKREKRQPWQVWELSLADGKTRQVTQCLQDCIRPLYLPEGRVVYARKDHGRYVLEAASLDGGDRLQLTYAPGNFLPNDVLQDGRILFSAGSPIGSTAQSELYTVYSDGSGVESYRCDHGSSRYAGRQLRSGSIVFAHHDRVATFISTSAQEIPVEMGEGEYAGDTAEAANANWLISWRPLGKQHFIIASWNCNRTTLSPVISDPNNDSVEPTPLASRTEPFRHPSGLHDWKVANLLTLDSHLSRTRTIEGPISVVRGYALDASGRTKSLGAAKVAADGSFFVQIPGDQPVRFELLDAKGKVVAQEHGWFWSRKGEQRVCIGCHTGPERAPDNAVPEILRESTAPADFTGLANQASVGGKR